MPFGLGGFLLGPDLVPSSTPIIPPPPLSGMTLWLRSNTGLYTDGTYPLNWDDQSGNGNNMIAPGGGESPTVGNGINGKSTAEFSSGGPQYFEGGSSPQTNFNMLSDIVTANDWSMFAVWNYTGSASFGGYNSPGVFMDAGQYWGLTVGYDPSYPDSFTVFGFNYLSTNNGLQMGGLDGSIPHYTGFIQDGNETNTQSLNVDGVIISQSGSSIRLLNAGPFLGKSGAYYWDGAIGEVIVYDRAVTSDEQAVIYNYLQQTWGLSPAPWTPAQLPNLVAWFRSDMGITQSGGTVSAWADLSGNGHNVSQSNSSYQPTYNTMGGANGQPRLTWSSYSTDVLLQNTSFTLAMEPVDIFIVATPSTIPVTAGAYLIDLGSNNDVFFIESGFDYPAFYDGNIVGYGGGDLVAGSAVIIEGCNVGSSSSFINVNGGTATTGDVGSNGQGSNYLTIGNYIGGSNSWEGDIYEVVICSTNLSSTERGYLNYYLGQRYGIDAGGNPGP